MKALEFDSQVVSQGRIQLPPGVADQIPEGSSVRVILLLDESEAENWRKLSLDRFSAAYAEEDAVYEQLENGATLR
jgi:hypothetical protein